jgi:hypothetical protein
MKRNIILALLLSMLMIAGYSFVSGTYYLHKEEIQCGTVIEIQNQPYKSKSVTYYNHYLLVNFDSIGMEAIEVDMTTFMSRKKGDRVCFMLNERQSHSTDYDKHELMGTFGLIMIFILIIIIIGFIF